MNCTRFQFCFALTLLAATDCWQGSPHEVVACTALDREFSEPVFEQFQREIAVRVLPKYDAESQKPGANV